MSANAKVTNVIEGILNAVTLGRAAQLGTLFDAIKGWARDFLVEEAVETIFKKAETVFGNNYGQEATFLYYVVMLVREGRAGELRKAQEVLLKIADMGLKGKKVGEEIYNKLNVNLDAPVDANGAAQQIIKNEHIEVEP